MGESILYLWVEKVREFLDERAQSTETGRLCEKLIGVAHFATGFTYILGFYSLICPDTRSVNILYHVRHSENLPDAEDFR